MHLADLILKHQVIKYNLFHKYLNTYASIWYLNTI